MHKAYRVRQGCRDQLAKQDPLEQQVALERPACWEIKAMLVPKVQLERRAVQEM